MVVQLFALEEMLCVAIPLRAKEPQMSLRFGKTSQKLKWNYCEKCDCYEVKEKGVRIGFLSHIEWYTIYDLINVIKIRKTEEEKRGEMGKCHE